MGTVTGKVTLDDKNMSTGSVVFTSMDGKRSGTGGINKDGTFKCTDAPIGKCKVTVTVPMPSGAKIEGKKGTGLEGDTTYVAIPEKYKTPDKTDQFHEVKSGSTEFNISMKSK
jgi:hypothetical protein